MKIKLSAIKIIILVFMIYVPISEASQIKKPVIIASTTMIGSLLKDIAGEDFEILVLIPPASCPGHFDLKPNIVQKIKYASLIVCHSFQKDIQKIFRQYLKDDRKWIILKENNSTTIPKYYIQAGEFLLDELSKRFIDKIVFMRRNWQIKKERISELEKKYLEIFRKIESYKYPVLVAYRQKEFIEYWGFKVIGVFDSIEGDNLKTLSYIIEEGKKHKAKAVIGNLQNGDRQAKIISEKLSVPYFMLSNFPGIDGKNFSYEELLNSNCAKLIKIAR